MKSLESLSLWKHLGKYQQQELREYVNAVAADMRDKWYKHYQIMQNMLEEKHKNEIDKAVSVAKWETVEEFFIRKEETKNGK